MEDKVKLRVAWGKRSSAIKEKKKRNAWEYQQQTSQSYNLCGIFAKWREKALVLEQTRLKEGSENMESLIEAKIIPLSSGFSPS